MLKITLSILTILALLQPFLFFYLIKEGIFFFIFPILGFLLTLNLLFSTYKQKSVNDLFNFIWSILILLIGIGTLLSPQEWVYVADAMVFMTEREAIVKKIKADENLNQQLDYTDNSIFPIALNNKVIINEIEGDKFTINFETVEDGFFSVHSRGILYSDKPEKIDIYEKRHTDEAGVIYESSFRIKKIKPHWYFYEFEEAIIGD